MQNKFSVYLTRFRKNHSNHHALLKMTENCKTKLNMGHKVGVIYMDLCKAFDSLNHELLIAKLKYYWLKCYVRKNMQLNFLEVASQSAASAVK